MENKASNNEDYMESYVMDLILMDGTRAEDITAFSSREVLWPSGIVKDDYRRYRSREGNCWAYRPSDTSSEHPLHEQRESRFVQAHQGID